MAELVDRDQEHLRLLVIGFYIMAGITGFFSLFSLVYIGFGAMFASGVIPASGSGGDAEMMGRFFLVIGVGVFILGLAATLLTLLAGRCLRKRRYRVFCVVIAALACLQIPWGTALGVCTIMVLNRPGVKGLFEPQATAPDQTS